MYQSSDIAYTPCSHSMHTLTEVQELSDEECEKLYMFYNFLSKFVFHTSYDFSTSLNIDNLASAMISEENIISHLGRSDVTMGDYENNHNKLLKYSRNLYSCKYI